MLSKTMKFCAITPLFLSLLLIIPSIATAAQFKVIRVYDGDTVKAKGHDIEIKVRLVGIDAPETPRKIEVTS